jgi:sugar lactone lactonase YvrE
MAQKLFVAAVAAAALSACTDEPTMSPSVDPEATAPATPPAAAPQAQPPAGAAGGTAEIPQTIVMERGGFIPEGIEYHPTNERFLVGSLAEGTVFEIGMDGSMTPFVIDEQLVSSVGIEVDEERNRLLVCNSDSSVFQGQGPGQAMLGVYSLDTGERLAMVDLTAAVGEIAADAVFFANDVAVGGDGSAYVTDTQMHLVYRVDPDGQPSVLHRFDDMPAPNGIVYHDGGYLLVVGLGNGNLYKIPVDAPETASQVALPEQLDGGDGMVWASDGRLAVVSNSTSRVITLVSNDDWGTAELAGIGRFEGQGTTAAVVGDEIYVVKPHFADQDPPSIERASFD